MLWLQRCGITWLKEGDHNTKYFHRKAVWRARKNQIKRLGSAGGSWRTIPTDIQRMAASIEWIPLQLVTPYIPLELFIGYHKYKKLYLLKNVKPFIIFYKLRYDIFRIILVTLMRYLTILVSLQTCYSTSRYIFFHG